MNCRVTNDLNEHQSKEDEAEAANDSKQERERQIEMHAMDHLNDTGFYVDLEERLMNEGALTDLLAVCVLDPAQGGLMIRDLAQSLAITRSAKAYDNNDIPDASTPRMDIQDPLVRLSSVTRQLENEARNLL